MSRSAFFALQTRRSVIAALLALPSMARGQPACPAPTILFVCPAGTVKSAIAREVVRSAAARDGVGVSVISRGIEPEDHVSPGLAARLKADGIDPAREPALKLQAADAARADIVIAFDEAAQAPALKGARVWDVPSWNADYGAAKAALTAHTERLISELQGKPCAASPP
jgi:hypothetical protein